jgi:hypothetical protein
VVPAGVADSLEQAENASVASRAAKVAIDRLMS